MQFALHMSKRNEPRAGSTHGRDQRPGSPRGDDDVEAITQCVSEQCDVRLCAADFREGHEDYYAGLHVLAHFGFRSIGRQITLAGR
jgi:hypothetical protein